MCKMTEEPSAEITKGRKYEKKYIFLFFSYVMYIIKKF